MKDEELGAAFLWSRGDGELSVGEMILHKKKERMEEKMRNLVKLRVLAMVVGLVLLFSATGHARDMLVNAAWLAKNRGRVIVIDARAPKAYMKGHIPGAVDIPVGILQTRADGILYPVKKLEKTLGKDGLTRTSNVAICGTGMEIAYLEYWMFDCLGMDHVHVINGGIENWKGSLSTTFKTLPPATFKAIWHPEKYATTAYILHNLHNPHVVLLDVRTPAEYIGEDVRALRGGHIPGAINMSHVGNFIHGASLLKPVSELARRYAKLEKDKNKTIVTYCQTGTRAANTYFVLKLLGFPHVRVYDASWIVWGSDERLPVADLSYYNWVSGITIPIKKLEREQKAK